MKRPSPSNSSSTQSQAFVADAAYDSSELIQKIDERDMQIVIRQHPRSKTGHRPLPRELYRKRFHVDLSFSTTSSASVPLPAATKKPPVSTSSVASSPALGGCSMRDES